MTLLTREWAADNAPIAFPAWRVWEDRRVRADNSVMALFAGARIAGVSAIERAGGVGSELVGDLYSDEELPFRGGFRITLEEAMSRWSTGIEDLSRMAIVVAVAALDDLLGESIGLLRATSHDTTAAGSVRTGVSAKLTHLERHGGVDLDPDTVGLYRLLVQIRHAVTHHGARQRPVRNAWHTLSNDARIWWTSAGGRALPLTTDDDELRIGDRELLAALKTLDRVALGVAQGLRETVSEDQWADLALAEYRQMNRSRANDPGSNRRRLARFASSVWRITLPETVVDAAFRRTARPELVSVVTPLIA